MVISDHPHIPDVEGCRPICEPLAGIGGRPRQIDEEKLFCPACVELAEGLKTGRYVLHPTGMVAHARRRRVASRCTR